MGYDPHLPAWMPAFPYVSNTPFRENSLFLFLAGIPHNFFLTLLLKKNSSTVCFIDGSWSTILLLLKSQS